MIRLLLALSFVFTFISLEHTQLEAKSRCVKYRKGKCVSYRKVRRKRVRRKKVRRKKVRRKKKTKTKRKVVKKKSSSDEPNIVLNKGLFRIRKTYRGREYRIIKENLITPGRSSKTVKINKYKKTFTGKSRCEAEANSISYYENNLKYRKKICKKFGKKTICGRNHRELYLLPEVRAYFNAKDPNKKFNQWARNCRGLGNKTAYNTRPKKWKHDYSKSFFKYFDIYGDRFIRYINKKYGFKDLGQFCDAKHTFHEAPRAQKKLFFFAIWKQLIFEESKLHPDILNKQAADPKSRCAIGFIQANPNDLIKFSNSVLDNTDDFSNAQVQLARATVEKSDHQLVADLMDPDQSIRYGLFMSDLLFNWSSNRCSDFKASLCAPRYSMARNKPTYWGGMCEFWEPMQFKKTKVSQKKSVRIRELANEICSRSPKGLFEVAEKMGSVGRYKYNAENRSYYVDDPSRRGITVKELKLAGLTPDMVDHRVFIPLPIKKEDGLDELALPMDVIANLSRKAHEKKMMITERSLSFRSEPNERKRELVCGQLKENFEIKGVNLVDRKGSKFQWIEFEVTEDIQKRIQNKECKTMDTLYIAYKEKYKSKKIEVKSENIETVHFLKEVVETPQEDMEATEVETTKVEATKVTTAEAVEATKTEE